MLDRVIYLAIVVLTALISRPVLADPGCGSTCTACVLAIRTDILPFYADNGWDTSCGNHDNILSNWCGIDPTGCHDVKSGPCAASCGMLPDANRPDRWTPAPDATSNDRNPATDAYHPADVNSGDRAVASDRAGGTDGTSRVDTAGHGDAGKPDIDYSRDFYATTSCGCSSGNGWRSVLWSVALLTLIAVLIRCLIMRG